MKRFISTFPYMPGQIIKNLPNLSYIKHSCQPNSFIENQKIKAIKMVKSGDEITINYFKNLDSSLEPFVCNDCNRVINGIYDGCFRE